MSASRSNWVKIALAVSFAANLFFIGLMAGSFFGKGKHHRGERRDSLPASFVQTIGEDRAKELRGFFTASGNERSEWREMRDDAWTNVYTAMAAQPFDRAVFDAALVELRSAADMREEGRFDRLGDFAETLTAEERAAFAKSMIERRDRRRERRNKRDKK